MPLLSWLGHCPACPLEFTRSHTAVPLLVCCMLIEIYYLGWNEIAEKVFFKTHSSFRFGLIRGHSALCCPWLHDTRAVLHTPRDHDANGGLKLLSVLCCVCYKKSHHLDHIALFLHPPKLQKYIHIFSSCLSQVPCRHVSRLS